MPAGAGFGRRENLPMPATVDVSCPHCGKSLKVPAELAGKRVKCKGCDEVFAVPAPKPDRKAHV